MSAVRDRLNCLSAILRRREEVRHLAPLDAIRHAFRSYGSQRRRLRQAMRPTALTNDLVWVPFDAYGIAWPVTASLDSLATAMVEVLEPRNGHYYLTPLTGISAGDCVIDVGACEGNFAMEALARYEAAVVYAFEPSATMRRALMLTAERNHVADRLEIIPAAAGRTNGFIRFDNDQGNPLLGKASAETSEESEGSVRLATIDAIVREKGVSRVDYIKVDAEGSDVDVLLGAEATLRRWTPAIAVTTYHQPDHANILVDYITSLGLGYRFEVKGILSHKGVARPIMLHAALHAARP
jgi:FkbM family methyltransferase